VGETLDPRDSTTHGAVFFDKKGKERKKRIESHSILLWERRKEGGQGGRWTSREAALHLSNLYGVRNYAEKKRRRGGGKNRILIFILSKTGRKKKRGGKLSDNIVKYVRNIPYLSRKELYRKQKERENLLIF